MATTAMLVPIFAGYLSDRTSSRWGRRRPWMVIGTVFNVIGVGLRAFAGSPALVVAAYVFVQASNNAASAAYAGVIPDVVGVGLVGVVLAELGSNRRGVAAGYAVIVVILLVSLLVSIRAIHEAPSNFRTLRSAPRRPPSSMVVTAAAAFLITLAAVLAVLVFSLGTVAWAVSRWYRVGSSSITSTTRSTWSSAFNPQFPAADLLPVQRQSTFAYRVMRILLLPVFHVLFVLQVRGRDNVPKRSNFLLIANDLNWLTNLF